MVMQENAFVVRRYTLKNLGLKDYCVCNNLSNLSNISSIIIVAMIREINKADTGKTLMTVVSE